MTMAGRVRRLNSGSAGITDSARCPSCRHYVRIHNAVGCVDGPCECTVTRLELMPDAPRLEVPDGIVSTPAAPPAKPTPPPAAAAPAPAVAPAAPAGPVGEPPAPRPVIPPPPFDGRTVDEIIAAGKAAAKRPRPHNARPAAPTAQGSQAVVGGLGAVEEVAAAPPAVATVLAATVDVRFGPLPDYVQATPGPLDLAPFLNRSLTYYAAWACTVHPLQRRHDPGGCPDCSRALVPVYVVIAPRSVT